MSWFNKLKEASGQKESLLLGMDIGSTTAKIVVLDNGTIVWQKYERHFSQVRQKAVALVKEAAPFLEGRSFCAAVSGSAGLGLAKAAKLPFIQEVFATGEVVQTLNADTDVVVELGGEDAKVIFFKGGMDERMNGTCAGGTGAFIDQMATLLSVSLQELDDLSLQCERLYPIASRCGVFAKSDIQPLLNQGAKKEDIAASIFQAVVDQTIAGLAQGRKIEGQVMFLGGPLYYCKGLRNRFKDTLELTEENAIFPEYSRFSVALGAAFYAQRQGTLFTYDQWIQNLIGATALQYGKARTSPLFKNPQEYEAFLARHNKAVVRRENIAFYKGDAYLGIDCGSTTTKLVLITPEGHLLHTHYSSNEGDPVEVVRAQLLMIYSLIENRIHIAGSAVTGYGEELIQKAFHLNGGLVETMAHFRAAKFFNPNVNFILDIGGQDMKCLTVKNNAIDSIVLNEACSSGCGSFIETFAKALGYPIADFARLGLFAKAPVELGSRCTVFMNSSVKQAQKDGADVCDISAGLSESIVKNALYKVLRVHSADELGEEIVVQGGTFLNDAVLRAFERELGGFVTRPKIAGLMGAFGAALFAKDFATGGSALIKKERLEHFTHTTATVTCNGCTNHCALTINTFSEDEKLVSGNKCERGALLAEGKDTTELLKNPLPNMYRFKRDLLKSLTHSSRTGSRGTIGLPLSLGMFELAPLWKAAFEELGFNVLFSGFSNKKVYARGQYTIPSDTACYPAKLMHGHIEMLLDQNVDAIFYPCLTYNVKEQQETDNNYNCPIVAYYSEVLKGNMDSLKKTKFLYPYLCINNNKELAKGLYDCLSASFRGINPAAVKRAVDKGMAAYALFMNKIRQEGLEAIKYARMNGIRILVLAGRPYHIDPGISQGIDQLIESLGFVVVTEDCVRGLTENKSVHVLNQWSYHSRLYNAAKYVAEHNDCEMVQLVSFGCGLDAITTDEVRSILESGDKLYTQIKIDEISNLGAAKIRLRSLLGALEERDIAK